MSRITLMGWYNYDNSILSNFTLPSGVDEDILRDEILERCGDLYTYYQQPEYLNRNIHNWFKRNLSQFQRLWDTMNIEYNPIENYDRYEDLKEIPNITITDNGSLNSSGGNNTESKVDMSSEEKRSAFDASTYQPYNMNTSNNSNTSETNYSDSNESANTRKETGNRVHENHIHGNIGVTTNQQMIQAEREITNFDFYAEIAERFERKFMVQVY